MMKVPFRCFGSQRLTSGLPSRGQATSPQEAFGVYQAVVAPWGGVFGFAFLATPGVHHCIDMARVVLRVLVDEAKEYFRRACLEALPFIHATVWTWCGVRLLRCGLAQRS